MIFKEVGLQAAQNASDGVKNQLAQQILKQKNIHYKIS